MGKQAEPTPSTSKGSNGKGPVPTSKSKNPEKSTVIETSSQEECQKAISEILKKKGASGEEITIEYLGSELMDDLLPNLFEPPSAKDKEEIAKQQRLVKNQPGQNTVIYKNVIVSETPREKDEGALQPTGEKLENGKQENGNLQPIDTEAVEKMYKKLLEQLPSVEGFDSEAWGEAVVTDSDTAFYNPPNHETEEEKNQNFEEFLNGTSNSIDSGDTGDTVVLGNGPSNAQARKTDYPDYVDESNDQFGHFDNDINEIVNDNFEGSYPAGDGTGFDFGGRFDFDISKLTPSFVLDYVLSTSSISSHVPIVGNSLDTQEEEPGETSKESPDNEFDAANYEIGSGVQPNIEENVPAAVAENNISEPEHSGTQEIEIIEESANRLLPTPTSDSNPIVNAPAQSDVSTNSTTSGTIASNSQQKLKSCRVVLTRCDEAAPEKTSNKLKANPTDSSEDIEVVEIPKSAEVIAVPLSVEDNQTKLSPLLKCAEIFAERKSRRRPSGASCSSSTSESKPTSNDVKRTLAEDQEEPSLKLNAVDTEVTHHSRTTRRNSQLDDRKSTDPQPQPCTSSSMSKEVVMDNGQSRNNSKSSANDVAAVENSLNNSPSNAKIDKDVNRSSPSPRIAETPTKKNVRTGLRRKGSGGAQGTPTPAKRQNLAVQTSQSPRFFFKLMTEEVSKPNPDLVQLSNALASTFDARKRLVEDPDTVVNDIVQRYPALNLYQMVKVEYGRVLGDPEKMIQLEANINGNLSEALNLKKNMFRKRHRLWEKAAKDWSDTEDKQSEQRRKLVLGMVALCFHFSENAVVTNLCKILKENEILQEHNQLNIITPTLVLQESQLFETATEIWIYVETKKYLKVPNFYEGVLCIYAMYYVFNMVYDKKLQSMFEFFDYVNGIPQNTYTDTVDAFSNKKIRK